MNIAVPFHAVRLAPPFYQGGAGCGLHRYLDADFVNRYRQDVQRRQFSGAQFWRWQDDERHSRHGQEPVLRLPLHRAFHIVSCEVQCQRVGFPALDPARISSAGFVIRRLRGNREQAFMLEDGEGMGWQDAPGVLRDPDLHRRLCANGVLHARSDAPTYSGEEVHPLHVLPASDETGRSHTLLFGYLPLGGSYLLRSGSDAFEPASMSEIMSAAEQSLPWPFGYRKPLNTSWTPAEVKPLDQGRPTKALFELLRLLVNRYHLGEARILSNDALERLTARLKFYDTATLPAALRSVSFDESNHGFFAPYAQSSLLGYLQACFARGADNPLARWLVGEENAIEQAGGLHKLPALNLLPKADGNGHVGNSLLLLPGDAQELRELLGQRLRDQALAQIKEIPLPKFSQGAEDRYQILPFVRAKDDNGREQIQWAQPAARSVAFRVAAPFDAEASRPSLIQMPALSDLKRGLAKGVSVLTPGDTFDRINSLKFSKGASAEALPDGEPGPGLGIAWLCSFSLPVISLVAMMLLMIMIGLLNIIFFWMPWVRICLPLPKISK